MNTLRRTLLKSVGAAGILAAATPLVARALGAKPPVSLDGDTSEAVISGGAGRTALVLVDPYNDFLSEDGKAWPLVGLNAEALGTVPNMQSILDHCRSKGVTIAYAPHHRYREGEVLGRQYLHPSQIQSRESRGFESGTFGGSFYKGMEPYPGDVVASEHDTSSGFAGTDLDVKLKQQGVTHLVVVGMITNTCIEATLRSAVDLGYHTTVVEDAVAAFSPMEHHAAVSSNYPLIANRVITTERLLGEFDAIVNI